MFERTIPYDDDDMYQVGVDALKVLDDLNSLIEEKGPIVAEKITCTHCGDIAIEIHAFSESIKCGKCGRRNVSNVPIYPDLHKLDEPL